MWPAPRPASATPAAGTRPVCNTTLSLCRRETEEDDLTCACRAPSAALRPAAPPWRAARRGGGRRCRGRGGCRGWGRAAAARGPGPCLQHSARWISRYSEQAASS